MAKWTWKFIGWRFLNVWNRKLYQIPYSSTKCDTSWSWLFLFTYKPEWLSFRISAPAYTGIIQSITPRINNYYTPNQSDDDQEVDEILYDSNNNSLDLGDPLNYYEIQVVGRFNDLFYNRYTDLETFLSRRNTTLPDDEAVNQEFAIILQEYGNLLRNNRTTLRQLENWRNCTRADGPMIHAFYSKQQLSMMEAYHPGMSEVVNQVFSVLLTDQ